MRNHKFFNIIKHKLEFGTLFHRNKFYQLICETSLPWYYANFHLSPMFLGGFSMRFIKKPQNIRQKSESFRGVKRLSGPIFQSYIIHISIVVYPRKIIIIAYHLPPPNLSRKTTQINFYLFIIINKNVPYTIKFHNFKRRTAGNKHAWQNAPKPWGINLKLEIIWASTPHPPTS